MSRPWWKGPEPMTLERMTKCMEQVREGAKEISASIQAERAAGTHWTQRVDDSLGYDRFRTWETEQARECGMSVEQHREWRHETAEAARRREKEATRAYFMDPKNYD